MSPNRPDYSIDFIRRVDIEEINIRTEWILERVHFDRICRDVTGNPSFGDKVRALGSKIMDMCEHVTIF